MPRIGAGIPVNVPWVFGESFAHPERHDNPLSTPCFPSETPEAQRLASFTLHGFVFQNPTLEVLFSQIKAATSW